MSNRLAAISAKYNPIRIFQSKEMGSGNFKSCNRTVATKAKKNVKVVLPRVQPTLIMSLSIAMAAREITKPIAR
jgi:hypothetical protein